MNQLLYNDLYSTKRDDKMNCEKHGFLKENEIKIVTIKKIEYKRCIYCKREKDRKTSKKYRENNKEYYAIKNKEHYEKKPEMAMERQRRYRAKKKALIV